MADPQTPLHDGAALRAAMPRLAAFDRLFAIAPGRREMDDVWTGWVERMRFRVGASSHDRRVPFAVGDDVARGIGAALTDLVALVKARAERDDRSLLDPALAHIDVRERHYGFRTFREGSAERRLGKMLVGSDPYLDAGLLESWLMRGGGGGPLLESLRKTYTKSLEEEVQQEGAEPLTWATHLALQLSLASGKENLKIANVRGVGYETLERTVGLALSALAAIALDEPLSTLRARGISGSALRQTEYLPLAISPLNLVGIKQAILRLTPNPYDLTRELAEAVDAVAGDPLDPEEESAEKIAVVIRNISRDRDCRRLALDVAAANELRGALLHYLRDFDVGKEPRHEAMLESVLHAPTLSAALRDGKAMAAAVAAIKALSASADGARRARATALAAHFSASAQSRSVGSEAELLGSIATSWLTWRYDRWAEEQLDAARAHLIDRGKEFGREELDRHYNDGKVYRLAPDARPILRAHKAREDGHLFLDLKGFTRMVAISKELSTAEFLKHEFYVPILQRALGYRDAGRRVELNNLLGDAVSFSGDIGALVFLAEDIRNLFSAWEGKFKEMGTGRVEAGLFIAHGAAAETITIDSAGWGDAGYTEITGTSARVKVAISEKINESARGTARNGIVWARAKAALAAVSSRGGAAPELPWAVYVDRVLQLTLPPDVNGLVELALAGGNAAIAADAGRKVGALVDALVRGAAASKSGADGSGALSRMTDIYNVGRALSKEALDAFLRETAALRVKAEKEVKVGELHGDFRKFVFPEETLRMVISWNTGKVAAAPIVFRYAGELSFRGFEGLRTTSIYEILDSGSSFYRLLQQHYLAKWKP